MRRNLSMLQWHSGFLGECDDGNILRCEFKRRNTQNSKSDNPTSCLSRQGQMLRRNHKSIYASFDGYNSTLLMRINLSTLQWHYGFLGECDDGNILRCEFKRRDTQNYKGRFGQELTSTPVRDCRKNVSNLSTCSLLQDQTSLNR
jgi:hypothetical protein